MLISVSSGSGRNSAWNVSDSNLMTLVCFGKGAPPLAELDVIYVCYFALIYLWLPTTNLTDEVAESFPIKFEFGLKTIVVRIDIVR